MRAISIPLLCVLGIAFGTQTSGQSLNTKDTREPAKVVFVCEHGSVKSLVAMEHFNRRARERGLPYQAVARGLAPDRAVPEAVRVGYAVMDSRLPTSYRSCSRHSTWTMRFSSFPLIRTSKTSLRAKHGT